MNESRLSPGVRVGPYEILALLGEGGMGQVYEARDLRLSREVALKILRSDVPSDKGSLLRFADEARAASLLSHPNIVAVYDIGDMDGSPYIISELLQGETLRDRLASGPLQARKAIDYSTQILRGLAAAHDKGIIHRDLKPENLFLTKDGLVKILDFGIAKLGRQGEERADSNVETRSHTTPGTLIGTVGYMSPEQVRGLAIDHRSDLFAFGAVLFEMLTGKRAFKGTTVPDTLSAILREDPLEASGSGSGVPAGFIRVVRRSLEKAPEDRFQTARDLAFALEASTTASGHAVSEATPERRKRVTILLPAIAGLALGLVGLGLWLGRRTAPKPDLPAFQRLTYRPGEVDSARFAPDGETIVYSAKWGNRPMELFSTRASTRGERPLSLTDALIMGISVHEEMALLLRPRPFTAGAFEGTLARAPLAGGAPREILEGVVAADWSPDGKDLAVVHVVGDGQYRLEYPIGHVLYSPEPPVWLSNVRISPAGDRIAFQEHPVRRDNGGSIGTVDREGRGRTLAPGFADLAGLCWSPSGDEVWFGGQYADRGAISHEVRAVSLSGRQRAVTVLLGNFEIFDTSHGGQLLGANNSGGTEVRARARGAAEEADLYTADYSFPSDLSDDGKLLLGTDTGEGGGANLRFYLQGTDGSPPIWLGEGDGQALSPDRRLALAVLTRSQPQRLIVVPVGPGETRTLDPGPITQYLRAVWDGTGRRVVFAGVDTQDSLRVYVQDLAGGPPRAVTPDGVGLAKIGRPVSPDGQRMVALGPDDIPALYPLAGGEPAAIPDLRKDDVVLCWTIDGRGVMVARYESDDAPPRIERVDLATGQTRPWNRSLRPPPAGLQSTRVLVAPDGESYAYSYLRAQADLYVASNLR